MALPARRVPESVAHLDVEIIAAALIRHDANIRNAARALDVPSGDLRKLVLVDQRLADAALEAIELRLDDAEFNLCEALRCDDPRRRDAISMFMLRNTQRASKRGYAVAASAASLEMNINTPPTQYAVVWGKPDEPDRELAAGEFVRDGRILSTPSYGGDWRDADVFEGKLAAPAQMIEHEAARAEPAAIEEPEPPATAPEFAAVRYERERIDAWIRSRLIAYPLASCLLCRKPIIAGQDWQEVSNGEARARFHRTCHAEWRAEREATARQALGLQG